MKITHEIADTILKKHEGDVCRGSLIVIRNKKCVSNREVAHVVRDGKLYYDGELCDWRETKWFIYLRYRNDLERAQQYA